MIWDLQKANMSKRISAFLFDFILLCILAVLFAWALSGALGFDGWQRQLDGAYQRVGEAHGVDLRMKASEYDALDEAGKAAMDAAYAALSADQQAVKAYAMIMQLSVLIVTFGVLLGYLVLEFAVPLKLGNGITLGKKIFGLALMQADGVRIRAPALFIRPVLGKFAIETMIPLIICFMIFWNAIGVVGPAVLLAIALVEGIVMLATPSRSMIHDLLAKTVVVDFASQMIFETREDMIHYKEKKHAEMAAKEQY